MGRFLKKYGTHLLLAGIFLLEAVVMLSLTAFVSEKKPEEASPIPGRAMECDLGDFSVQNWTDPERSIRVDFKTFAVVSMDQEATFQERLALRQQRVRDAINAVVRTASRGQIHDAELTQLKKSIATTVASTVGVDARSIESIVIPEFKVTDRTR